MNLNSRLDSKRKTDAHHTSWCRSSRWRFNFKLLRNQRAVSFSFTFLFLVFTASLLEARPRAVINKNDVNMINNDKAAALPVEKLLPPDHLDGMKMEQDGKLNKDFHKESFLGNHEEIESDQPEIAETKLKDIFHKVDTDQDGLLSVGELESWITDKIQEHFDEALEENDHIFKHLDPHEKGAVDWKDYYIHFLLAKGYPLEKAAKHVEDYDVVEMSFEERDQLIRYKFKWTDADVNPIDNKLNKEEFLAFRHPEHSRITLENMLRTILNALDKNGDGILTEDEFASLPVGIVEDDEQTKLDKNWVEDRRNEFRKFIDIDMNGKATKEELMKYMDPRNPENAKSEAKNLIQMIDGNEDGRLSLEEILKQKDIFINSKCVEIGRSLHDEF